MKPITNSIEVERYGRLAREMMLIEVEKECEFSPQWVYSRRWKVVPVESMARIPDPDIPRIVSALNGAGYKHCLAVFNEAGYIQSLPVVVASDPPSDMATSYLVSIDEGDFHELNRQLGPFRFLLMSEDRSWAISCTECYNLFGAKPDLLEALLGKPIEQARQEFFEYASLLATGQNPDESILQVAKQYAAL